MSVPPFPHPDAVVEPLRRVPLFAHLSDVELDRVRQAVRDKDYPKGSVILFEQDPGSPRHLHTVRGVGFRFEP